jgi:hypothetical protein
MADSQCWVYLYKIQTGCQSTYAAVERLFPTRNYTYKSSYTYIIKPTYTLHDYIYIFALLYVNVISINPRREV